MSRRELRGPLPMRRVAVVAPARRWRGVLAEVADEGVVELDLGTGPANAGRYGVAAANAPGVEPRLSRLPLDRQRLEASDRADLAAGEAELDRVSAGAVTRQDVTGLVGWAPAATVARLDQRLSALGGALVELPIPRGVDPPTSMAPTSHAGSFRPLVETYGIVPYHDIDPTRFAAVTYVAMFGMMFGDVGDGLVLLGAGWLLRRTRRPRLARYRRAGTLIMWLGLSATLFGFLFGEAFGPTGLVPVAWIAPLDHPTELLAAAVLVGGCLLAMSFAIGTVNRWREGGPRSRSGRHPAWLVAWCSRPSHWSLPAGGSRCPA